MSDTRQEETRIERLRREAKEAAEIRALRNHPDVVALRVERTRRWVNGILWLGIVLGLAYTVPSVQRLVSDGAQTWSMEWWTGWPYEPMLVCGVFGFLIAEQVTARYGVESPGWVRYGKWVSLGATYTVNTWSSWAAVLLGGDYSAVDDVVVHSIPVVIVLTLMEAGPQVREALNEAAVRAHAEAKEQRAAAKAPAKTDPAKPTPPAAASSSAADPKPAETKTETAETAESKADAAERTYKPRLEVVPSVNDFQRMWAMVQEHGLPKNRTEGQRLLKEKFGGGMNNATYSRVLADVRAKLAEEQAS